MKKKTASVLLAFAVIISLCACNSSQRSRDSSDSSTQSETEQVITEAEESTGGDTEKLSEDADTSPASENNALTSIQEQLEASGVPVAIMDESLLYSLSDWKTETGIDNDRFTEFATAMFTDFDAFQATYLQPAFDEIVGR